MAQLTWKDFQNNLSKFVFTTQESPDFFDVTLVVNDNYQVHASKIMLCSASLFFKRILVTSQDSHTLIYLEDVSKQDLENIVSFIFTGEVKIDPKHLANFMSISEDLQLTGLLEAFVAEDAKYIIDQDNGPTNSFW